MVVAVVNRCNDQIREALERASTRARADGQDALDAMSAAYLALARNGELARLYLHAQAASVNEPRVRAAMKDGIEELYALTAIETGRSAAEIRAFFGRGMVLNLLVALDALDLEGTWARTLVA